MSQFDQAHEIMQQIDTQLNEYLASRGIGNNSEMLSNYEKLIQQTQIRNNQLQESNNSIKKQISSISYEMQNIKQDFQERLNQKLQLQQIELSSQFEQKVSSFGEKARIKLMNTLQQEDQCLQQFNNLVNDKTLLQQQIEVKQDQNEQIQVEKSELEQTYQNLLQMHNQLLQVDMSQNELSQNRSNVLGLLNNYKVELEQLKSANEKIQKQMGGELEALKIELQRQKSENENLIQKLQVSSQEQQDSNNIFAQLISQKNNLDEQQKRKRNKSKSSNQKIKQVRIAVIEKELKRLQGIINSKIQQKKQKKI